MKTLFLALFMIGTLSTGFSSVESSNETIIEEIGTCDTIKQLAYDLAISEGADPETAEAFSNIAYNNCKNTTVDPGN